MDIDICPRCTNKIDPTDSFCRHCGIRVGEVAWYHTKIFVLASAFILLGPFALPLLLSSRDFTRNGKVFWSLAICAYTLGLVLLGAVIVARMYQYMIESALGR